MFVTRKNFSANYKRIIADVDFSAKNRTDAIVEESSENAAVIKGALTSLRGTTCLESVKGGIDAVYEFPLGRMMCVKSGVAVAVSSTVTGYVSGLTLTKPTFKYCEKQKGLIISEAGIGTFFYNGKWKNVADRGFSTLAICNERVFGVEGNKLYFTERDNVNNWNGELELPAPVVAVTEYGNGLLAVGRQIYKIELADNAADTKVTCLSNEVGNVCPRTLGIVGKQLIFLTDTGLHCFNQNKLSRLCADVDFSAGNFDAVATGLDGYWLAYVNKQNERKLLHLDTAGEYRIYGIPATSVTSGGGRIVGIADGKVIALSDSVAQLFWKSKEYDFGNRFELKYLRKMYVVSANNIDVHLVTERERRIFHVAGGTHIIRLRGIFGKISVEIHSKEEAHVEKLALEVQRYGREVTHGYNI